MPGCKNCPTPRFAFETLYNQTKLALETAKVAPARIAPIIAIEMAESYGNAYFRNGDVLMSQNLSRVNTLTGCDTKAFLKLIQTADAMHHKITPQFRIEPAWWAQVNEAELYDLMTVPEKALLSCSIGIGQKSMLYLFGWNLKSNIVEEIFHFAHSPLTQILQIHLDLVACGLLRGVDFALVATRYNAGGSAKTISEYGRKAQDFTNALEAMLTKKDIPLCSSQF